MFAIAGLPRPEPLPLPAPAWLLWGLLMLTFLLHVIPMNLVLGGSIIGASLRARAARGDRPAERLAAWIARAMPVAIAAAVTFGVAPLLFLQVLYGRVFFTSAVLIAWFWLAIVPLLLGGYYASYYLGSRRDQAGTAATIIGWVLVAVWAVIAFIQTTNMSLMLRVDQFTELYAASARGLHLNLSDPSLVPRYLHMVAGAIAVAGLALALAGRAFRARDDEMAACATRTGTRWAAVATGVNVVVGSWWIAVLPRPTLARFAGGDAVAAVIVGVAIALGMAAVVMTVLAAQAPGRGSRLGGAVGVVVLTTIAMLLTRNEVRRAALDEAGFVIVPWVVPQWGPFAIFGVLLVVSLGSVAWMVLALARGGRSSPDVAGV